MIRCAEWSDLSKWPRVHPSVVRKKMTANSAAQRQQVVWHTIIPGLVSTGVYTYSPHYLLSHSQARLLSIFGKSCPDLVTIIHISLFIYVQHIGGSYTSMGRGTHDFSRTRVCMTNQDGKDPYSSRSCHRCFSLHRTLICGKWRKFGQTTWLGSQIGKGL